MRNELCASAYLYLLIAVAASEPTTWKYGKALAAMSKQFTNLKLIVCRKRQPNLGRISLLKRKAQPRRKQRQREKHKIKTESQAQQAWLFYVEYFSGIPPKALRADTSLRWVVGLGGLGDCQ